MGYACPVCSEPQADGTHLANHLAFTALLHDDAHADWLDGVDPEWADRTPEALADAVVDHAEPIEAEPVSVEETDRSQPGAGPQSVPNDPAVRRIIDEAIEMTRERLETESEKD